MIQTALVIKESLGQQRVQFLVNKPNMRAMPTCVQQLDIQLVASDAEAAPVTKKVTLTGIANLGHLYVSPQRDCTLYLQDPDLAEPYSIDIDAGGLFMISEVTVTDDFGDDIVFWLGNRTTTQNIVQVVAMSKT